MYSTQAVRAVAKEKDVNYSSYLLWVGLYLKQRKFGFNITKNFLSVSLVTQEIALTVQATNVYSLEVFMNHLSKYLSIMD